MAEQNLNKGRCVSQVFYKQGNQLLLLLLLLLPATTTASNLINTFPHLTSLGQNVGSRSGWTASQENYMIEMANPIPYTYHNTTTTTTNTTHSHTTATNIIQPNIPSANITPTNTTKSNTTTTNITQPNITPTNTTQSNTTTTNITQPNIPSPNTTNTTALTNTTHTTQPNTSNTTSFNTTSPNTNLTSTTNTTIRTSSTTLKNITIPDTTTSTTTTAITPNTTTHNITTTTTTTNPTIQDITTTTTTTTPDTRNLTTTQESITTHDTTTSTTTRTTPTTIPPPTTTTTTTTTTTNNPTTQDITTTTTTTTTPNTTTSATTTKNITTPDTTTSTTTTTTPTTIPPPPTTTATTTTTTPSTTATTTTTTPSTPTTISPYLKPLHYTLHLQPFLTTNHSVKGEIGVEFEVLRSTSALTLHADAMIIDLESAKVERVLGEEEEHSPIFINHFTGSTKDEVFTAHLNSSLHPGSKYRYTLHFTSHLNHTKQAFYTLTYTDAGVQRKMALTTLFPNHAHRVFPCLDELGMEATIDLLVTREKHLTAVSNMPLINTTQSETEGWVLDRFATTPVMEPAMLVLVLSQFTPTPTTLTPTPSTPTPTPHTLSNTTLTVWTRKDVTRDVDFLLRFLPRSFAFLEEYFNLSYPLPKLDIFLVPAKQLLAVSHPGLITILNEDDLLDSLLSHGAIEGRLFASQLLIHEVSHQWLGNLALLRAWEHLWIFEGLASYIDNVGVGQLSPWPDLGWEDQKEDLANVGRKALWKDGFPKSQPLQIPSLDLDDILQSLIFIIYEKGSSVLYMLSTALTPPVFKSALSTLLRTRQYQPLTPDELWQHLTEEGHRAGVLPYNLTVKTIMDTWTLQMGYPVITVNRTQNGTGVTVYQERFVLGRLENQTATHSYKWWVPLTYTSQTEQDFNHTKPKVWMRDSQDQLTITDLPSKDQWVIFNLQQTGYYRVNYDLHNWRLLTSQLFTDHTAIHVINRAQIVDDAMNFARAGSLPYAIVLELSKYLKREAQSTVWKAAFSSLSYLDTMLATTPAYGGFREYVASLVGPLYNHVEDTTPISKDTLRQVVKWACHLGHDKCVQKATSLYKQWMQEPEAGSPVPEDSREAMYCAAVSEGGEAEWDFGWERYHVTQDSRHKDQLLKALACTKDAWRTVAYLDTAFKGEDNLRAHDPYNVLKSVAGQNQNQHLSWTFLNQQWTHLTSLFNKNKNMAEALLKPTTEGFNTRHQLAQVESFLEEHREEAWVGTAAGDAVRRTEDNVAWMDRSYDQISHWLTEHGFSSITRF